MQITESLPQVGKHRTGQRVAAIIAVEQDRADGAVDANADCGVGEHGRERSKDLKVERWKSQKRGAMPTALGGHV